jgi:transcriptional regulator with XRE-family HTH domain
MAERVGVSERTVQNYESDEWHRRTPVLRLWASATGVPLEWLLTGEFPGSDQENEALARMFELAA